LPTLATLLDAGEQARVASLHRDDDRRRFVSAHVLLRLLLSQTTGLPGSTFAFAYWCDRCAGAHGKPHVVASPGARVMHVSIAHAGDRVVVAVTSLGPVGVDVEPAGAADFDRFDAVALTATERAQLRKLPADQQAAAATSWWVRKEAVLKATGLGMSVAPEDIEISPPTDAPRLIAWRTGDPPSPPARLTDLALGAGYVGCVAVLSDRAASVRVTEGDDLLAEWAAQVRTATR
jgi:4'-phosphopantetheinyl transferase